MKYLIAAGLVASAFAFGRHMGRRHRARVYTEGLMQHLRRNHKEK